MILLEIIGCLFLIAFFTFPIWISGNWKTFTVQGRKETKLTKIYLKEEKERFKECRERLLRLSQIKEKEHICTQYQPFQLSEKKYAICNFICDGDCQFKGTKYYKISE